MYEFLEKIIYWQLFFPSYIAAKFSLGESDTSFTLGSLYNSWLAENGQYAEDMDAFHIKLLKHITSRANGNVAPDYNDHCDKSIKEKYNRLTKQGKKAYKHV